MVYKIIIKELKCNHWLLFQIFTLPISVDLCIDWAYRTYMSCEIVLINDKYSILSCLFTEWKSTVYRQSMWDYLDDLILITLHPKGMITESHTVGIQSIYVCTFAVFKILLKV